jgi:hypothetical protein
MLQAHLEPTHTKRLGLSQHLLALPVVVRDAVARNDRTGPVSAAFAVHKNRFG